MNWVKVMKGTYKIKNVWIITIFISSANKWVCLWPINTLIRAYIKWINTITTSQNDNSFEKYLDQIWIIDSREKKIWRFLLTSNHFRFQHFHGRTVKRTFLISTRHGGLFGGHGLVTALGLDGRIDLPKTESVILGPCHLKREYVRIGIFGSPSFCAKLRFKPSVPKL